MGDQKRILMLLDSPRQSGRSIRPMGRLSNGSSADCKSATSCYVGSNPTLPTQLPDYHSFACSIAKSGTTGLLGLLIRPVHG